MVFTGRNILPAESLTSLKNHEVMNNREMLILNRKLLQISAYALKLTRCLPLHQHLKVKIVPKPTGRIVPIAVHGREAQSALTGSEFEA